MAKLRVYLDTSVFSALHDDAALQRQEDTKRFWVQIEAVDAMTNSSAE